MGGRSGVLRKLADKRGISITGLVDDMLRNYLVYKMLFLSGRDIYL